MRVIEHIQSANGPQFSFEIIPPARGRTVRDIIEVVETLLPSRPKWIDVTSHSASAYYHENKDGSLQRRTYKKRPGTIGICGVIQNRFKIDTVAHVLCLGFSREETEDALIELNFLGVENILALRGDGLNFEKSYSREKSVNFYASDLVRQVVDLRKGQYCEEISNAGAMDFCVGVAGYPEKHFEAANLRTDIMYLKQKVDAGAEYIVTQMFFDNSKYFSFVKACRETGINVPIIPGLKILTQKKQLLTLPKIFHIDVPQDLYVEADKCKTDAEVREVGIKWCIQQSKELMKAGSPCLHFYTMGTSETTRRVASEVF